MKHLLVFLLLLPFCSQAQKKQIVPEDEEPIICWQEGIKLRWGHFQSKFHPWGEAYTKSTKYGACVSAEIAVDPYKDSRGKNNFNVKCFFKKQESWVRDSTFVLQFALLAHERLHFDICELFGRKIRQVIAREYALGHNVFGSELGEEIKCLLMENEDLDALYDQETSHGTIAKEQQRWAALIKRELASLEAYKSTAANCK